jgi:DNA-binding XRE family transcriptional regulator
VGIPYQEVLARESKEMQLWVERRAAELIAEELNLRELRRLRKLTQSRLSKKLKIGQEGISRIERRQDMNVSTLRSYVEGVGGELWIEARFPDQPPVVLTGLGGNKGKKTAKTAAKSAAKSKSRTRRAA